METCRLGPVELVWQDGDLRYLRIGRTEVLRRIYGAVRDATWGTIPAQVELRGRELTANGLRLTWHAHHRQGPLDFGWEGSLTAAVSLADDRLELRLAYELDGRAAGELVTNRTGLCVLHPVAECAGQACDVIDPAGTVARANWPAAVAPHQPFRNVRGLRWWPGDLSAELTLEGDVFETEDQRNWSDGSYKTYSRPLSEPFPYRLAAGERVRQRAELRVAGPLPRAAAAATITVGAPVGPLPAWGLRLRGAVTAAHLSRVRPSYLRVDVGPAPPPADLPPRPLELGLHLPATGEPDWAALAAWLATRGDLRRVIVYRAGSPLASAADVALVRSRLRLAGPVGPGTIGSFAELNRARPDADAALLAWPICPQVHATDDLSLVENLQGLAPTVATARQLAAAALLCVGPLLFWRRPDPFAAGCGGVDDGSAPADPRLAAPLGAAWTLGALAALSAAGADAVTLYDVAGPYGVQDDSGVYPVGELLAAAADLAGGEVLTTAAGDPLRHVALAVRQGARVTVLVANLRPTPTVVMVQGLRGAPHEVPLAGHAWQRLEGEQDA